MEEKNRFPLEGPQSIFRLVCVGGSITTGYAASPPSRGWAGLVASAMESWFPRGLSFFNRGVSGTDSASGALRVASHCEGADLVILEFAVNDQWLDPTIRRQTFEGCLRQILVLPQRPRVLCLFLCEKGGATRGQGAELRVIAEHYGVASLDFGVWLRGQVAMGKGNWDEGWDEADPIHPNSLGHRKIAEAVVQALPGVLEAPGPSPASPRDLRDPLYSSDWQFVRSWTGGDQSADVHSEWLAHGGAPRGWRLQDEGQLVEVCVHGKVVGLLHSESEHARNLEAWIDDDPVPLVLQCEVASRKGYLGWNFRVLARNLLPGEHRVRFRLRDDQWTGSGRSATVVAVVAAGGGDGGDWKPPAELPLHWTGRFDPETLPGAAFGWQLTSLKGRFTGNRLSLRFGGVRERNYFQLSIDGRGRTLEVCEGSPLTVVVGDDLVSGEHRFELVKRSEGLFGSATLIGLSLADQESWLPALAPARHAIEFYGDSITAGACNEDGPVDQYDTLVTHDALLSYASITARRLGADVISVAVSGTGLTCSWNPIKMLDVWDRYSPSLQSPRCAPDRIPSVVVINLGQNDWGFPLSEGRSLDPAYSERLLELVQRLRHRYPKAWIVGALGGMTAPTESEDLLRQWNQAWSSLAETDSRVRNFVFVASSPAHPRVDVHALLAEELTTFLTREVWPHLEAPLY